MVRNNVNAKKRELYLMLLLAAFLSTVGGILAYNTGARGLELVITLAAFTLLVTGYCLLASRLAVNWLRERFKKSPWKIWAAVGTLLIPYLLYALGTGSFNPDGALRLAAFIGLPTLLLFSIRKRGQGMHWQDALAILAIWLPFDFRLLKNIWAGKVTYGFNTLVAVNLALLLFVCYARVEDVGYRFRLKSRIFTQALFNFLLFAPIAIIVGLGTGFLTWAPQQRGPLSVLLTALGIFLFIAIPEELLFRGLIQNLLAKTLKSETKALIIASIIFGSSHLNNASYPKNLIYFLLATIAGIFYGRAYIATGALLAAAITHTLVDTVWHELFK
jgi:uncharacterized protein